MNEPSQIRVGNFAALRMITAADVDYPTSEEHLTKILCSFNLEAIVIFLARINLLLQRSNDYLKCERILRKNFCSQNLREEIQWRGLTKHIIFNRQSTLRLLSLSVNLADSSSARTPDETEEARNDLARCYLIANGLAGAEDSDVDIELTEHQKKDSIVELIPSREYAINPSPLPHIKKSLVRSEELLARFRKMSSEFDVSETFSQATCLTLQDYQYLIYTILNVTSHFCPEDILEGDALFVDIKRYSDLTPLYEKLLQQTCVSIDELPHRTETSNPWPDEFRLWRQYPLVKLSENQVFCVDIGFLLAKIETGVFWILRNQLEKEKKNTGKKIIRLRGEVVESYTASIIKRGINSQALSYRETYMVSPTYDHKDQNQCTDIAVCGNDALVLLECKAPLLTARSKFSGEFIAFHSEMKRKVIVRDGKNQLWDAIQKLGHTNKKKRLGVKGLDMSKVKLIYPVLVLEDIIFSLLFMNWYFDLEFQRFVKYNDLRNDLQIMPLSVLTIDDLENLEPYLRDTPLHEHLHRWISQFFRRKKSFPFGEYLRSLSGKKALRNAFTNREIKRIHADMREYFTSRGVE